ncbi:cholecystokinin receptor type A-like isoform X1 [Scyliorhinus torazame]|uniref:cholecystokinin receptor type A-like isoform X1 n=1 Tax=Scyliorhinus torazame TaxID=75743 RepID=UPI003B5AE21B
MIDLQPPESSSFVPRMTPTSGDSPWIFINFSFVRAPLCHTWSNLPCCHFHLTVGIQQLCPCLDQGCGKVRNRMTLAEPKLSTGVRVIAPKTSLTALSETPYNTLTIDRWNSNWMDWIYPAFCGQDIPEQFYMWPGISVSVSTFSLVAISLERYSAICKPLKSRVWQTKSHAFKVITVTWLLSVVVMLPYPIYNTLVPFTRVNNSTGNMCRLLWPNDFTQQSWYIFLLLILFLVPGIVMTIAYGLISRELYSGIQFEMNRRKRSQVRKVSSCGSDSRCEDGDGCYIQNIKRNRAVEMQRLSSSNSVKADRPRCNSSAANLMAKKRVIRMLIVIVIMFFICWTPIFCVNAWRAFDKSSADRLLSGTPISFIHLLSYTSACVNPIIYCFMNKRFRVAFLATFPCGAKQRPRLRETEEERHTTTASISRCTYTNVSVSTPS